MVAAVPGIYCIINLTNGHRYVGSSLNMRRRWKAHMNCLQRGRHDNEYLQRSWNKHGPASFICEVLQHCPEDELASCEQFWIEYLNSLQRTCGYNLDSSICGRKKHSPSTCAKISAVLKGRLFSDEHKKNISLSKLGIRLSDEHKQKIGSANKDKVRTPETRKKMSDSNIWKGRHLTDEMKKKISANHADFSGENSSTVKLTWALVREIRERYLVGSPIKLLAGDYGVQSPAIWKIVHNKTWRIDSVD